MCILAQQRSVYAKERYVIRSADKGNYVVIFA